MFRVNSADEIAGYATLATEMLELEAIVHTEWRVKSLATLRYSIDTSMLIYYQLRLPISRSSENKTLFFIIGCIMSHINKTFVWTTI